MHHFGVPRKGLQHLGQHAQQGMGACSDTTLRIRASRSVGSLDKPAASRLTANIGHRGLPCMSFWLRLNTTSSARLGWMSRQTLRDASGADLHDVLVAGAALQVCHSLQVIILQVLDVHILHLHEGRTIATGAAACSFQRLDRKGLMELTQWPS